MPGLPLLFRPVPSGPFRTVVCVQSVSTLGVTVWSALQRDPKVPVCFPRILPCPQPSTGRVPDKSGASIVTAIWSA